MSTLPSKNDEAYVGFQDPTSTGSDVNALGFAFKQFMSAIWTSAIVQVVAVTNNGELAPVGNVDVKPLVHQIDGAGNATLHGTIYSLPYFRVQGGVDAIILDPKIGDIGLAIFASRDISAVKVTKAANVPGSRRRFDASDGLYIGGFLNGVPEQYVRFSATGIELVSPTQVKIQAPDIQFVGPTHTTGAVTGDSTAEYVGEVTGDGHSLSTHVHSDAQGGDTGEPIG